MNLIRKWKEKHDMNCETRLKKCLIQIIETEMFWKWDKKHEERSCEIDLKNESEGEDGESGRN